MSPESDLIYDWNSKTAEAVPHSVSLADETLRDGLQSPSVRNPPISEKLTILHLMESLGIQAADIGLPGAGPHVASHTMRLAREITEQRMRIRPYCAARTVIADIRPIVEISQRVGYPIEVAAFIGTSPIRQYAEDWDLDAILSRSEEAVRFAIQEGLPVMFVTEDTTRSRPDVVRKVFSEAIRWGARAVVVCDTVGHATPRGVRSLIRFVFDEVIRPSGLEVRVDWHGHSDRGLGVINAITAFEAGAHQLHASGLGIGERVGNTSMDLLLVNLRLMGYIAGDLSRLKDYCRAVSEATDVPIPANYPVVGEDAFRTGTGVHAAAVIKALKKGDVELANLVYSGVPSHWFGLEQRIEVGPVSGKSNVVYWLEKRGIPASDELIERIFAKAKSSDRVLTEKELLAEIEGKLPHSLRP
jgi:isopropylmalate/homocitrate/citramalate synthase